MTSFLWGTAVISILLMTARKTLFIASVHGRSMEPQFFEGDRVLAARAFRLHPLRAGDVVVVKRSGVRGGLFIKNIVAAPGDLVPARFLEVTSSKPGDVIPKDRYLLLGRHRASEDSKYWGFVELSDIVGRVIAPRGRKEFRLSGTESPELISGGPRAIGTHIRHGIETTKLGSTPPVLPSLSPRNPGHRRERS